MADNASQILNFNSSDSDSESENLAPATKKRKIQDWLTLQIFPSLSEAKNFVKMEKEWVYEKRYSSSIGDVIKYLCRKSSKCSANRRLLLLSDSLGVELQKTSGDHDHDPKPDLGKLFNK